MIVGGINAQHTECTPGLSAQDCADAKGAGTTIGVMLILALWAAVDFIVGLSYVVYRFATRKES